MARTSARLEGRVRKTGAPPQFVWPGLRLVLMAEFNRRMDFKGPDKRPTVKILETTFHYTSHEFDLIFLTHLFFMESKFDGTYSAGF